MPNTFELIASSTVGAGGASSITFTSIPNTYTDLVIKLSLRDSISGGSVVGLLMYFNSDNGTSSYETRWIRGSGSAASSLNGLNYPGAYVGEYDGSTATSNTFASTDIYIPNYAGSQKKSFSADTVQEDNATAAYSAITAGLWKAAGGTAAITSITFPINPGSGANFAQYSTAYLYGIKNS